MAAKKAPPTKAHITGRIGLARNWLNTALSDIRRRNDRLDALDSLRFAERAIRQARKSILGHATGERP